METSAGGTRGRCTGNQRQHRQYDARSRAMFSSRSLKSRTFFIAINSINHSHAAHKAVPTAIIVIEASKKRAAGGSQPTSGTRTRSRPFYDAILKPGKNPPATCSDRPTARSQPKKKQKISGFSPLGICARASVPIPNGGSVSAAGTDRTAADRQLYTMVPTLPLPSQLGSYHPGHLTAGFPLAAAGLLGWPIMITLA